MSAIGRQASEADRHASARELRTNIGSTGLRRSGGFIQEEFLSQLRGRKGARYFGEMVDNCAVVGMSMTVIESLIRQVEWPVRVAEGYEEDKECQHLAEVLESMLHDMEHPWEDFISEVLSMLVYGFAPFEMVFKVRRGPTGNIHTTSDFDDGLIGLRKLEIRAQETVWEWDFDEEGTVRGFWQNDYYGANQGEVYLPMDKVLLFKARSAKGNPEGRSLLRSAVREYHYLKRLQENEAIGIGKDLTGMVVMEVPREILATNPTPEDAALRRELEKMVQELQVDERMGSVFPAETDREGKPSGFKLRLLSSGGTRQIQTDPVIRRYETRIASSFLTEFMLLGQDRVGALNLHESKSNLFGVALNTVLDSIAATFNRYCVPKLMQMNGFRDSTKWPFLDHGRVFAPDLAKVGAFLQSMSASGVLSPNPALEEHLLEDADLPVPPKEDDIRLQLDEPTPGGGAELALGVLSRDQIDTVLSINEKVASGQLGEDAARTVLASALGMEVSEVDRFLDSKQPATIDTTAKPAPSEGERPEPESPPSEAEAERLKSALNGAQVTAVLEIVGQVGRGELPRESGIGMLQEFFLMSEEQAERIMGPVGKGFVPAAPEPGPFA